MKPASVFDAHEDGLQKLVLLQTFNEQDHRRFQARDSEAFRGTPMVAALSYGFDTDLRTDIQASEVPSG